MVSERGESVPISLTTVDRRTTACTTADRAKPRISAQRISHVIEPAMANASTMNMRRAYPLGVIPPPGRP